MVAHLYSIVRIGLGLAQQYVI